MVFEGMPSTPLNMHPHCNSSLKGLFMFLLFSKLSSSLHIVPLNCLIEWLLFLFESQRCLFSSLNNGL